MLRTLLTVIVVTMASAANAAPCIDATASCTEWVPLGGSARSLIYRTYPLDAKNEHITRAFVMVHGAGRDADHYFTTAVAAAFLARALDDAVVIAPRFASSNGGCRDELAADETNWPCSGNSWRSGGAAANAPQVTSFDLMDAILQRLPPKSRFPNLKA